MSSVVKEESSVQVVGQFALNKQELEASIRNICASYLAASSPAAVPQKVPAFVGKFNGNLHFLNFWRRRFKAWADAYNLSDTQAKLLAMTTFAGDADRLSDRLLLNKDYDAWTWAEFCDQMEFELKKEPDMSWKSLFDRRQGDDESFKEFCFNKQLAAEWLNSDGHHILKSIAKGKKSDYETQVAFEKLLLNIVVPLTRE